MDLVHKAAFDAVIEAANRRGISLKSADWTGNETETNISRGFASKWAEYEDAWKLLEG
jgi:hypothetical protein